MAYLQKRVSKDGTIRWRVQVRLKGHPIQSTTFDKKSDAKKWADKIETEIREGRHFPTSHAKRHTVADVIDRYKREVLVHRPNATVEGQLEWWKSELGHKVLADMTVDVIASARATLLTKTFGKIQKKTVSRTTANRYVAALSGAFTLAVREWRWIEMNPIRNLKKLDEPSGRVRFLTDHELESLLTACTRSGNEYLYPIVILALSVGARKANIVGMTWKQVDLERGLLFFERTKTGHAHRVPLRGLALELVKKLHEDRDNECPYVFPNPSGKKPIDIRSAWERARRLAKLEDFHFHDLRHSCASFLAMDGAGLHEIAEVLGHSSLDMTRRYAHLTETRVGNTIENMNKKRLGG